MTSGALLLLNFLRSKGAGTERGCYWKQQTIAAMFGKSVRTVNRWLAELKREKKIKAKLCGSTSATYWLFENCGKQMELNFQNGVPATPKMAHHRRRISITEALKPEKENQSESTVVGASIERSPSEIETLKSEIAAFRFRNGDPVEASPELIAGLCRKAEFYRVSLYVLAAHFERARRVVERIPSHAPESPGWFMAVAENALKPSIEGTKPEVRCRSAPRKPPEAEWNIRGPSNSGFEQNIADLVRRKRLA